MNYTALLLGLAQIMSPLTGTGEIQNMQAQAEVVEIAADDPVYIPGWTYGEEPAEPVLEDGYDLVWVKFAPKTDALEEEWTEDVPSEAGKYIYLALVDDTQQGLEVEYSGEFEIEPKDLSGLEIHISPAASRDDLQILDGETILVLDKDYTVTEQGDFLEITFIGNYTGNTEIPLEKEIQAGWIEDEDGLKYVLEDGSYAAGWILINQDWYWFDENNVRYTGWLKDPNSGAWYWLDLDTGIMWHDAWLTDNGVKYYLGSTGSWIKDGWKKEGSSWKYVLGDGTCYNDGFHKINGLWYYCAKRS